MTDKEIIEGLKAYITTFDSAYLKESLDLINRQKAEIEELKLENRVLSQNRITMPERLEIVNNARDKAIREFAERLKDVFVTIDGTFECFEVEEHIDELVKETTEDEK